MACWFVADGDHVGEHLERLAGGDPQKEAQVLSGFSASMRSWAEALYNRTPEAMNGKATVIYAGGDDLLGALHALGEEEDASGSSRKVALSSSDLFLWIEQVFPSLWKQNPEANRSEHRLTLSMGLVWATGRVPQREVLQHAREAEARAKDLGRDRFALRLLFPGGQHLEWVCPWDLCSRVRTAYRDREQRSGPQASWKHLAEDVLWLKSRTPGLRLRESVALSLWRAYFPDLGDSPPSAQDLGEGMDLGSWLGSLARVMVSLGRERLPQPASGPRGMEAA